MSKIAQKICTVALVCVTLIFVVLALLATTNVVPQQNWEQNGALTVLLFVLAAVYVALCAYLLFCNFAENANLRRILLFCDSQSATRITRKALNKLVHQCAGEVSGTKPKKIVVKADDKQGFALTLKLKVDTPNLQQNVDKLRCLLVDSLKQNLGLTFNSINFDVTHLGGRVATNRAQAAEQAQTLGEERAIVEDIYDQPMAENRDCCHQLQRSDKVFPLDDVADVNVDHNDDTQQQDDDQQTDVAQSGDPTDDLTAEQNK